MENQFKENKRYLVKDIYDDILEIIVLEISEKAIKVKFDNSNSQWHLKDNFPYKFVEELPTVKQTIKDRSNKIQFDDAEQYEPDEPEFTLKITEENNEELKLKSEEKPKLEWEQNPPKKPMDWYDADEYAKSLGDGWRLPKKAELLEATDNKVEGFKQYYYWSSSTCLKNTKWAEYINFSYGYINLSNKLDKQYVRCVREIR